MFDVTKEANLEVFNKVLTKDQQLTLDIINKVKSITKQNGGLIQSERLGKKDKQSRGDISSVISVTVHGLVIETKKKSEVRIVNGSDFVFSNKFFGMNKNDKVYEVDGLTGISENVYFIGKPIGYDASLFNDVYLSKLMKFVLLYYRGTNTRTLGWSIRELPLLPDFTYVVDSSLHTYFNLSQEETDHIENTIED